MNWRDYLPNLRRIPPREQPGRYQPLITEFQLANAQPYRIPTTGRLVSDIHRDYYMLAFDPSYATLSWDTEIMSAGEIEPSPDAPDGGRDFIRSPLSLTVADTAPEQAVLADFHLSNTPVVSEKVAGILRQLEIEGLEFFPVRIRLPNGALDETYSALYLDREIKCLDEEHCQFQTENDGSEVLLKKMALDAEKLESVELPQRLAFRPEETGREYLFHAALVEALSAQKLHGARFVPVRDWRLG